MKKLFGLMVLVLLVMFIAAGTAMACPNPDEPCTGNSYNYQYTDETSHQLWCKKCRYTFPEGHYGGNGTCITESICGTCKEPYINPQSHTWSGWTSNGDGTHTRTCTSDTSHTETKSCSGGTATCTDKAICTDCGQPYGEVDPDNHDWGEWLKYDGNNHTHICTRDQDHYEIEPHSGGTPTCNEAARCEVCDSEYFAEFNHGDNPLSDWMPAANGVQHYRTCQGCQMEFGEWHSGGAATCTEQAVCETCAAPYGEVLGHDWGEWYHEGPKGHTRDCNRDRSHYETESHSGGTPTCSEAAPCEVCRYEYFDRFNHGDNQTSDWKSLPTWDEYHYNTCLGCSTNVAYAPHVFDNDADPKCDDCGYTREVAHTHSGGTATCTEQAVCEGCGQPYGEPPAGHIPGAEADCTNDQLCTRNGCGAVLKEKLGHQPGAEADCTNDQLCTCEGCGAVLKEKLGHAYEAVVTSPTCTSQGYTTYTCSRCGETYVSDQTPALEHWYDLWHPDHNGTHSAQCKRSGCNHVGTTECTLLEITVLTGETETRLTVCPVCGAHGDTPFAAVPEALVKPVGKGALPRRGEKIVRGMDAPFNGVLYAFTVAHEYAGKVDPFNGTVSVTLPLAAEKYAGFKLVRVDVELNTWTDVAFTFENGELTFETDVAGLFLLVPVE